MKKVKLTSKQFYFLCLLNNPRSENISLHHLGKQCFKTWRSTSLIIKLLLKNKLISKEQDEKEVKITLTKKGKDYIINNFKGYQKVYKD